MKEINLKYLDKNFLTLDEVATKSGVSTGKIRNYIEETLTPQPSYKVCKTFEIISSLDDKHTTEVNIWYFPKSYVELVKPVKVKMLKK